MADPAKNLKIDWKAPKLRGMCFAFTGRFKKDNKKWILQYIKQENGKALSEVTEDATHLIVGTKGGKAPTAQERKAAKFNQKGAGIQVIEESDFWSLLTPTRDECIAMLKTGDAGCQRWNQFHPKNMHWLCRLMPIPNLRGADWRGADWRRPAHHETTFQSVRLDGADLRGAKLQSCDGLQMSSVNLEGASFNYVYIKAAVDCSFRNANVNHCHFDSDSHLDRSDFTGATISNSTFFYDSSGSNVIFKKLRSKEVEFRRCKLPCADFSGADLTGASMDECDFTGGKFTGAILAGALLHKAKLNNTDLRKADLRSANLAGADLTGANINGADFTGANVAGVTLAGVDGSRARGLKPVAQPGGGLAGPSVQQLASIAAQSAWLQTTMKVERKGKLTVTMEVTTRDQGKTYHGYSIAGEKYLGRRHEAVSKTLPDLFAELASQWGAGELLIDSLFVDVKKGPIRKNALQPIALAAWYEAFGRIPPSENDLLATRAQAREEFLALLRQGKKGVEQWNGDVNRLEKAGGFQGVDLSGLNLAGIRFQTLDFTGARFDKAVLTKARTGYGGASFKQTSFRDADLSEASLTDADCSGADFSGAIFSGSFLSGNFASAVFKNTQFSGANVWGDYRGADLSGAKLANAKWNQAKFNEHTRWPKDFQIPKELKWVGAGADPRIADLPAARSAGPIDFAAFSDRLRQTMDADRLKKALSMLKADRFKLYAQVTDEFLVGVVKSQTDKDLVYSCRLAVDGSYACCTQNLNICGGLRGSLCKHLLVLIVGLTKGGQFDPGKAADWVDASRLRKPVLGKDAMSETLLRYKGAEAGEIDWRPTETIPEDFYAM